MKHPVRTLLLSMLLGLAVGAPSARAGDKEAQALYEQAYKRWSDPEPAEALRLAAAALQENPSDQALRCQIELFIGSLHQAKTGNFDAAIEKYDHIIRTLVGATDAKLRQLKANAMVSKGTILYTERDDADAALRLYQSAHEAFQLSTTVDTASQLAFRMGRNPARPDSEKKTFMDFALKSAQEAVQLAPRELRAEPQAQRRRVAKCRLQLVIVLTSLGKTDEAQAEWAKIDAADLTDSTLYQRAVLHALRGEAEPATDCMKRSMGLRSAAPARNQLRKMIRTEPDLAALRERPEWKELVTDEPVPGKR